MEDQAGGREGVVLRRDVAISHSSFLVSESPTNLELTAPNSQFAVSNVCMTRPNRWLKTSLFLLFSSSILGSCALGQGPAAPVTPPALFFNAIPAKQFLERGEAVVFALEIYNGSEQPILVSRLKGDELVKFNVIGPDGKDVPLQGEGRISPKVYSASDFGVLQPYHLVTVDRIISLKDGAGFGFDKPGQYFVTAEYSPDPSTVSCAFCGRSKGSHRFFPIDEDRILYRGVRTRSLAWPGSQQCRASRT
jgi:hypothetical protein